MGNFAPRDYSKETSDEPIASPTLSSKGMSAMSGVLDPETPLEKVEGSSADGARRIATATSTQVIPEPASAVLSPTGIKAMQGVLPEGEE